MASIAGLSRVGQTDGYRTTERAFVALVFALAVLLCIAVTALHPVGFVGGGLDDMRYLTGVECLVREGFCVPTNHWEARLPFVYPAAAIAAVFGESREALWIAPLIFSVAAISLFGLCVKEAFGRRAGLWAMVFFALCPEIANRFVDYSIDIPEFAFLAGGTFCLLRSRGTAAGILFALAFLCRPTTIAFAPFAAAYLMQERKTELLFRTFVASAVVLAIQAGLAAALTGDPFLTWRLALHHNEIPSSYLEWRPFHGNPILNMNLVAAWPPAADIDVPWPLRAPINFLGYSTLIVLHAVAFTALILAKSPRLNRLAVYAALYFAIVAYVFAIDPKPRMFLPVIAVECTIIAVFVARWTGPARLLAAVGSASFALICVATAFDRPDYRVAAGVLADWLRSDPGLQVEEVAASQLELRNLGRPIYRSGPGRIAAFVRMPCRIGASDVNLPSSVRIERAKYVPRVEPAPIARLRSMHLFLERPSTDYVCVYVVDPPATGSDSGRAGTG